MLTDSSFSVDDEISDTLNRPVWGRAPAHYIQPPSSEQGGLKTDGAVTGLL